MPPSAVKSSIELLSRFPKAYTRTVQYAEVRRSKVGVIEH